jgi:hypothetical protein
MEDEFVKIKDLKQGDVIEALFGLKKVLEVKKDIDDVKDNWITVFFTDGSKYHCIDNELISVFK